MLRTSLHGLFEVRLDYKEFTRQDELGRGAYGTVYRARRRGTDAEFAMKVLFPADKFDKTVQQSVIREIQAATKFTHPWIIRTDGFASPGPDELPVIITELLENGPLHKAIDSLQRGVPIEGFSRVHIAKALYGVADAMALVHSANYLHRDIKPQNILFDAHWMPRLADFGTSRYDANATQLTDVGTPLYKAPELAFGAYNSLVDVFAFGVTIYISLKSEKVNELSTGVKDPNPTQLILAYAVGTRWKDDPTIPRPYWELIQRCWAHVPDQRPPFEEIRNAMADPKFAVEDGKEDEYMEFVRFVQASERHVKKELDEPRPSLGPASRFDFRPKSPRPS
jgi:serine/threonine protein kinase